MTPKRVRKAVFPVGGLGTRFLPATKAIPKEMLPVVDRPAIQYVVEEAVQAGLTDILIITGRGKRAIEDHFDRNFELEHYLESVGKHDLLKEVQFASDLADLHYVRQRDPLGLGHKHGWQSTVGQIGVKLRVGKRDDREIRRRINVGDAPVIPDRETAGRAIGDCDLQFR